MWRSTRAAPSTAARPADLESLTYDEIGREKHPTIDRDNMAFDKPFETNIVSEGYTATPNS